MKDTIDNPPAIWIRAVECVALAVVYVLSARVSQVIAIEPGNISIVWIPSGLCFAAVYLRGYYLLPGILLGAFFGNIWAYIDLSDMDNVVRAVFAATANGVGDSLCILAGVWLLKRRVGNLRPHQGIIASQMFILYAVIVGSTVSASFGVGSLVATGFVPAEDAFLAFGTWWMGDAVGIVLIGSVILVWFDDRRDLNLSPAGTYEKASFWLFVVGVSIATHSYWVFEQNIRFPSLMLIPCLAWSSLRIGLKTTFNALLVVSVVSVYMVIDAEYGMMPMVTTNYLVETQLFIAVITTTVIFLSAVLYQYQSLVENLEAIKNNALEAAEYKSRFLASMSHEIRTPMNGIMGMNNMLLESPLDPEQQKYAANIDQCAKHLLSIANEVLELSRVEAGRLELVEEPFAIKAMLEGLGDVFAVVAEEKGIGFSIEINDCPEMVVGDELRLRQVLINLVSNAIKFTHEGSVDVIATAREGRILFEVRDTGEGVPPEKQAFVFDAFRQADRSTKEEHHGTGLGLYISQQLIHLMGSSIRLESEPGVGSRFYFEIELQGHEDKKGDKDSSDALLEYPELNARILVVEDNIVNQQILCSMLDKFGCEYTLVDNGIDAIAQALNESYDLVLMDCQLPKMNGYEAARQIRQAAGDKGRVPILAVTANVMEEDYRDCINSGMNNVITKPIDRDKLYEAVSVYVTASRF